MKKIFELIFTKIPRPVESPKVETIHRPMESPDSAPGHRSDSNKRQLSSAPEGMEAAPERI